jgi:sugar phosphate isomerase/epimerase
MLLAYNTNGLAHHDLLDAISLLSSMGYQGISITLDHGALNPYADQTPAQLAKVAAALRQHRFRCVIETGARFLLDPAHKHEPTLLTADPAARQRRITFLKHAIDTAAALEADCVSLWSGVVRDEAGPAEAFGRLIPSFAEVLEHATEKCLDLAFEPEPGMLIDTLETYTRLHNQLTAQQVDCSRFRLTIDVGHLHCLGETPIPAKIVEYATQLANVHIEDMRPGVHEHLMFGEGTIDFPPVIAALAGIRYDGLLSVELSRHSHNGPNAARSAYEFLRPLIDAAEGAKK